MTKNKRKSKPKGSEKKNEVTGDDDHTIQLKSQLGELGLVIKDMTGDGNCLFRALSDQYDGTPDTHAKTRTLVCKHILERQDTYAPFLDEGDSIEIYVKRMSKSGVYGGNLEIVAFARTIRADVVIHQAALPPWIISGEDEETSTNESRRLIHIAYHSWEHYSSVRNEAGPFVGPPEIVLKGDWKDGKSSDQRPAWERDEQEPPTKMEKMILNTTKTSQSLPYVRSLLKKYRGDPNKAMDQLFEEMEAQNHIDAREMQDKDSHDQKESLVGNKGRDDSAHPQTVETTPTPTKRISARVQKEQAKKKQKQQAMERKRQKKTARSSIPAQEKKNETTTTVNNDMDALLRQTEAIRI